MSDPFKPGDIVTRMNGDYFEVRVGDNYTVSHCSGSNTRLVGLKGTYATYHFKLYEPVKPTFEYGKKYMMRDGTGPYEYDGPYKNNPNLCVFKLISSKFGENYIRELDGSHSPNKPIWDILPEPVEEKSVQVTFTGLEDTDTYSVAHGHHDSLCYARYVGRQKAEEIAEEHARKNPGEPILVTKTISTTIFK